VSARGSHVRRHQERSIQQSHSEQERMPVSKLRSVSRYFSLTHTAQDDVFLQIWWKNSCQNHPLINHMARALLQRKCTKIMRTRKCLRNHTSESISCNAHAAPNRWLETAEAMSIRTT
jgi:hypothetical protein